jgi:hypothetical protein
VGLRPLALSPQLFTLLGARGFAPGPANAYNALMSLALELTIFAKLFAAVAEEMVGLGGGGRGFHRRDACATGPCPLPQTLFPRPLKGGWVGRLRGVWGNPYKKFPQPSPQNP